ncbi:MAG: carbohydrate ABC transporter permease [Anaerolineales bacterium]|nr:carbohydrate ABC transporter permease [Anaerolineales bacterium]
MPTLTERIARRLRHADDGGRRPRPLVQMLLYSVLALAGLTMVVPFLWMIVTSLRPEAQLFDASAGWLPRELNWGNYLTAWQRASFSHYALNTAVYAVASTAGQVLFGAMAGYAFARLQVPGRNLLFVLVLATMMIPFQMLLVPLFVMLRHWPLAGGNDWLGGGGIGLVDSLPGLILPNLVTPFGIFLMRQFTLSLPGELADAARIDGAGETQIFFQIMLPLTRPALVTLAIFAFQEAWNDFTWPLVISTTAQSRTLQLGLQVFQDQTLTEWGPLMAGTAITILPLIVIFIIGQRYFVEGIALTGTKG